MASFSYYGLQVNQYNNMYEIYNAHGMRVMGVYMPDDKQYIQDSNVMALSCKVLSLRWTTDSSKKGRNHVIRDYSGLHVQQVGQSEYYLYLPNGVCVCWVFLPPDNQYLEDALALACICKGIALRYGFKVNK